MIHLTRARGRISALSKMKKPISKSLDYPLYEKMKRKSPKASKYWIVGDQLYHAGLFLTMLCIPALFFVYTQLESNVILGCVFIVLIGSNVILALGIYFKRKSYKLAIKAGIDINDLS
jgi:hypothetical protein